MSQTALVPVKKIPLSVLLDELMFIPTANSGFDNLIKLVMPLGLAITPPPMLRMGANGEWEIFERGQHASI